MTVDYSKIDFAKCKLEPLGDLPIDVIGNKISVSICSVETGVALLRKEHDSVWRTAQGSLYMDFGGLTQLFSRGNKVDAFIAAETARIEAEEEAANWLPVPWQDVEFLEQIGVTVQVLVRIGKTPEPKEWRSRQLSWAEPTDTFRADRRTFPAGYDPTQPRWADIHWGRVNELDKSKCSIRASIKGKWVSLDDYCKVFNVIDAGHRWQVDAHTLPPGVPMHTKTKPSAPRPCTKEFALAHPEESEARHQFSSDGITWSRWTSVDNWSYKSSDNRYEFRATAKEDVINEPKTMTRIEFARLLIESNQEKYILVNGKCYGYRFNRKHCRIETGIATDHGTVDWRPSFGLGAASDVITVTE